MKTLKSYPSENPRVGGWPPWPSLGCFENPDPPWVLSATAFHPPSLSLPSAVRPCHLRPGGLLCSWTEDCAAWKPYCLKSDCPTLNSRRACPREELPTRRPSQNSRSGASRVLRLTLPALVGTSAWVQLFPGHLGLWFVWN